MKKNYLKWTLSSLLIIGSIGFATGKPDVAVKTPNLVIENQTGNSEIKSAKNDRTKLSQDRVKQIVTARVPGSNVSEIKDFRGEGDSFKGKLIHAGVMYDFEIKMKNVFYILGSLILMYIFLILIFNMKELLLLIGCCIVFGLGLLVK